MRRKRSNERFPKVLDESNINAANVVALGTTPELAEHEMKLAARDIIHPHGGIDFRPNRRFPKRSKVVIGAALFLGGLFWLSKLLRK